MSLLIFMKCLTNARIAKCQDNNQQQTLPVSFEQVSLPHWISDHVPETCKKPFGEYVAIKKHKFVCLCVVWLDVQQKVMHTQQGEALSLCCDLGMAVAIGILLEKGRLLLHLSVTLT